MEMLRGSTGLAYMYCTKDALQWCDSRFIDKEYVHICVYYGTDLPKDAIEILHMHSARCGAILHRDTTRNCQKAFNSVLCCRHTAYMCITYSHSKQLAMSHRLPDLKAFASSVPLDAPRILTEYSIIEEAI